MRRTTINITKATDRQISYLQAKGFGSFTEVCRLAIDRMYQQEKGTDPMIAITHNKSKAIGTLENDLRVSTGTSFVGAAWVPYTPLWQGGEFKATQMLYVMRRREGESWETEFTIPANARFGTNLMTTFEWYDRVELKEHNASFVLWQRGSTVAYAGEHVSDNPTISILTKINASEFVDGRLMYTVEVEDRASNLPVGSTVKLIENDIADILQAA
jgi:hypothetical protein